jgi:hypothetical protein
MWFKRAPKNRRLGREHVLDVKVRSSQARKARTRTVAIALGVAFAFVFGGFLLWRSAEWGLKVLVYENKAFALQDLDIQTDGVIPLDQLRRWTVAKPDDNLLALDLARVKRNLELAPLIKSVSVERVLPHTLRIRVVEREPIAQINIPRSPSTGGVDFVVFHLDSEGWVMVPLDPRLRSTALNEPNDQLPLICGIKSRDIKPGGRLESPQLHAALQLIVAFEHSPMVGFADFKRIDVSASDVLVANTGQGGEITFGLTDLEQQLRRWREIVDSGQKLGKAIATLDLAITNNIPARWLEANAVPPSPPKLPKSWRNKKKHV